MRAWRNAISPATFLGKGKVGELVALVRLTQAEVVVFCNPLTGTQKRNLEAAVGVPVLWYRRGVETQLPPGSGKKEA